MPIGDETLKRIVDGVSSVVMAEIRQLRREQSERHAAGEMIGVGDTVPNIKKIDGAALDMDAAVNRWQGLAASAQGSIARVAKEMQDYLKYGRLPKKH